MYTFRDGLSSLVTCPECVETLIVKTDPTTEKQFLGCPNAPECQYTADIPESMIMRALGQPELF